MRNPAGPFVFYHFYLPYNQPSTVCASSVTVSSDSSVTIPDGSDINGCCAVGTQKPYNYYFWGKGSDGESGWQDHGRLEGQKGDPYTWEDLTPEQKETMAVNTGRYFFENLMINSDGHLIINIPDN